MAISTRPIEWFYYIVFQPSNIVWSSFRWKAWKITLIVKLQKKVTRDNRKKINFLQAISYPIHDTGSQRMLFYYRKISSLNYYVIIYNYCMHRVHYAFSEVFYLVSKFIYSLQQVRRSCVHPHYTGLNTLLLFYTAELYEINYKPYISSSAFLSSIWH